MKKVVFFADSKDLDEALDNCNISSFSGKSVPIKLHMGELKNKHFVKSDFTKIVVNNLKKIGARPYLFDTTVSYPGKRHTKDGYIEVAKIHGFTNKNVGCDVIIDDTGVLVKVEGRDYGVADHIFNAP